jgi:hypothetical protein
MEEVQFLRGEVRKKEEEMHNLTTELNNSVADNGKLSGEIIENIDWPLKWRFGNRNDKRASRDSCENYVTETGQTYTFSPGHPNPTMLWGGFLSPLAHVHFKFAPSRMRPALLQN